MANKNPSIGLLLIGIAIVLVLGKLGIVGFLGRLLWPLLVLGAGLLLHYLYFNRTLPASVLVPGGMLVTYSVLFLYGSLFGWGAMAYLWPVFLFGAAVGLYEYQMFDRYAPRSVSTAALIVGALAIILLGVTLVYKLGVYLLALVLIAVGVILVVRRRRLW